MSKTLKVRGERQHNAHEDFLEAGQHQGAKDFEPRELAYGPAAVLGFDPDAHDEDDANSGISPYLRDLLAKGNKIPGARRRGGQALDDDTAVGQAAADREALDAERAQLEKDRAAFAAEQEAAKKSTPPPAPAPADGGDGGNAPTKK